MSSFTSPLIIELMDEQREGLNIYSLVEGFSYYLSDAGYIFKNSSDIKSITIEVPQRFLTDFASVPRFFRWLIPPTGKHSKAAVLHDFLCFCVGKHKRDIFKQEKIDIREYKSIYLKRSEADLIFKEALEVLKVNPLKRFIIFRAVWAYGRFKFKDKY